MPFVSTAAGFFDFRLLFSEFVCNVWFIDLVLSKGAEINGRVEISPFLFSIENGARAENRFLQTFELVRVIRHRDSVAFAADFDDDRAFLSSPANGKTDGYDDGAAPHLDGFCKLRRAIAPVPSQSRNDAGDHRFSR